MINAVYKLHCNKRSQESHCMDFLHIKGEAQQNKTHTYIYVCIIKKIASHIQIKQSQSKYERHFHYRILIFYLIYFK